MAIIKSLYEQFREQFFSDKNGFWRLGITLALAGFLALLGGILEKSWLACLGYGLLPLPILFAVLIQGSLYLQDIYEIDDFKSTFNYLVGSVLGLEAEITLKISGGKKVISSDKVNTLDKIGGPGKINVEPGNAVVLETLLTPTRILGAGEHRISRNEIIKEIVNLEEYYGQIPEIIVSTQDGIDVKISSVECRFRIDHVKHEEALRFLNNPYPFSVKAVRNLAYTRNVGANGVAPWPEAVLGTVKGIIAEHIANRDLDMLTSPNILEQHPLDDLRRSFDLNRGKFKGMGVNLLWINIGDFSVVSVDADKQLFDVWAARQSGSAKVMRARGESQNIANRERGRSEGQAVLLSSVAQALQDVNIGAKNDETNTAKNLWNIVLARTAQILESMTPINQLDDKDGQYGR